MIGGEGGVGWGGGGGYSPVGYIREKRAALWAKAAAVAIGEEDKGGDISVGSKLGAERTPEILAATSVAAATIKLGVSAAETTAAVAATETEDAAHGCCCLLVPFES